MVHGMSAAAAAFRPSAQELQHQLAVAVPWLHPRLMACRRHFAVRCHSWQHYVPMLLPRLQRYSRTLQCWLQMLQPLLLSSSTCLLQAAIIPQQWAATLVVQCWQTAAVQQLHQQEGRIVTPWGKVRCLSLSSMLSGRLELLELVGLLVCSPRVVAGTAAPLNAGAAGGMMQPSVMQTCPAQLLQRGCTAQQQRRA